MSTIQMIRLLIEISSNYSLIVLHKRSKPLFKCYNMRYMHSSATIWCSHLCSIIVLTVEFLTLIRSWVSDLDLDFIPMPIWPWFQSDADFTPIPTFLRPSRPRFHFVPSWARLDLDFIPIPSWPVLTPTFWFSAKKH